MFPYLIVIRGVVIHSDLLRSTSLETSKIKLDLCSNSFFQTWLIWFTSYTCWLSKVTTCWLIKVVFIDFMCWHEKPSLKFEIVKGTSHLLKVIFGLTKLFFLEIFPLSIYHLYKKKCHFKYSINPLEYLYLCGKPFPNFITLLTLICYSSFTWEKFPCSLQDRTYCYLDHWD